MMKEIWKDIKGYKGLYQISNMGKVKSLHNGREKILKGCRDTNGYLYAHLHKDGKRKNASIHRLVALHFIENPYNLPDVNHIKEFEKQNNCVDNLEWCSVEYNNTYGTRIERINKKLYKKVICLNTKVIFNSIKQVEEQWSIKHSGIIACCKGKRKSAGKHPITNKPLKWMYYEDYLKQQKIGG